MRKHRIVSSTERVYADTSVFGGAFEPKFRVDSLRFIGEVRRGRLRLVLSPIVRREAELGPARGRELLDECIPLAELVDVLPEAFHLQQEYLGHEIVTLKYSDDALHVAVATVSGCQVIVSWNFRHIVHYHKIPLYNAVNRLNGYGPIAIHTPAEVVCYGEQEEI